MAEIALTGRFGTGRVALVDDGDLAWLSRHSWYVSEGGYALARIGGRLVRMHRLILGLGVGDPRECDHVNRDRLDNRRANLRAVTPAENRQNCPARADRANAAECRSRHRGVTWKADRQKWRARVGDLHLGLFDSEERAAAVAAAARAELMPFAEAA